jgi:hypothetical protein
LAAQLQARRKVDEAQTVFAFVADQQNRPDRTLRRFFLCGDRSGATHQKRCKHGDTSPVEHSGLPCFLNVWPTLRLSGEMLFD